MLLQAAFRVGNLNFATPCVAIRYSVKLAFGVLMLAVVAASDA